MLLKGNQKGVLIINTTTILTAYSVIQNKTLFLTLNFINMATRTNYSKTSSYRMNKGRLFFQLPDQSTLILYAFEYFAVINLPDLTIRQ